MEVSGGNLWHIIVTGASFATCFVLEVASSARSKDLSLDAAVNNTARILKPRFV